ncbi:hypothetical protein [Nocardioides aquiterrae]|uniref:Uncharacterized protein n=1 Tax=Nocardioides aquiterrae TaxID=203799 RepID=A0ABN1UES3_9ACTN
MTTLASIDAGRVATQAAQAIAYERNLGVRCTVALLVQPFTTREEAHRVICRSVERQALLAGCGRVHIEAQS